MGVVATPIEQEGVGDADRAGFVLCRSDCKNFEQPSAKQVNTMPAPSAKPCGASSGAAYRHPAQAQSPIQWPPLSSLRRSSVDTAASAASMNNISEIPGNLLWSHDPVTSACTPSAAERQKLGNALKAKSDLKAM